MWCQHDVVLNIDLSYGALVSWVMLTAVHYQVEVSSIASCLRRMRTPANCSPWAPPARQDALTPLGLFVARACPLGGSAPGPGQPVAVAGGPYIGLSCVVFWWMWVCSLCALIHWGSAIPACPSCEPRPGCPSASQKGASLQNGLLAPKSTCGGLR